MGGFGFSSGMVNLRPEAEVVKPVGWLRGLSL
jgi:hypothetical protein